MKPKSRIVKFKENKQIKYKIQKKSFGLWFDFKENGSISIFDNIMMAEMYLNLKNMQPNGLNSRSTAIQFIGKI